MFCNRLTAAAFIAATAMIAANALGAPIPDAARAADSRPAADLIIRHAHIWTGNPKQPDAEAVAVLNGRIAAVGSDAEVMQWQGPPTRIVGGQGGRRLSGVHEPSPQFFHSDARC